MLDVRLIPALADNYIHLIRDAETGVVAVVDPAEAEPVQAMLDALGWRLSLILNTHHHADHTAGNRDLKARWQAEVIGPAADRARIPEIDRAYAGGEGFALGARRVTVLDTPGHTSGHIAFHVQPGHVQPGHVEPGHGDSGDLFCGDTLFSLGCGRLFEGTPSQMWDSLCILRALPGETRVWCGHEYTRANARFAVAIDPGNADLAARAAEVERLRQQNRPTLPSTIALERATNPFLRADDPDLAARLGLAGQPPVAVFAHLRQAKDVFRG
ncbi:MAG: putative glyoxalase [Pseudomonadota bacterium]|jgi:hydroxyacylglutathione hydrolase